MYPNHFTTQRTMQQPGSCEPRSAQAPGWPDRTVAPPGGSSRYARFRMYDGYGLRCVLAASASVAMAIAVSPRVVEADGGVPLAVRDEGGYRIAVFAEPAPLRAGPVDISILVQDAETGQHLKDVSAVVTLQSHGRVVVRRSGQATEAAATNKLFQAAHLELPFSGRWTVQVTIEGVHGNAHLATEVVAADALPRWQQMWVWFTWPAIPIGWFVLHQWLTARQEKRRSAAARKLPSTALQNNSR